MRGASLVALGAIIGFLPVAAFPMWPACLPHNDYVGAYPLWTALRGLEVHLDFFIYAGVAAAAAVIGGFIGLSVEQRIVDRQTATRLSQNCCPNCGYDLRGSATAVCPECGTRADARNGETIA